MIDLDGMISIPYLKKTTFTGSEKEMNFMIRKEAGENGDVLQAAAWPGPYIFSVTEDEKKTFQEFSFDNEGIRNAVDWLTDFMERTTERMRKRRIQKKGSSDGFQTAFAVSVFYMVTDRAEGSRSTWEKSGFKSSRTSSRFSARR